MTTQLELGDIAVDVVLKDIKNVHLSVHPPTGRARIAAPERMSIEAIRLFAISKLGWIKKQQRKLQAQERETRREYLERESHYVWGKRYLLTVVEADEPPSVELKHNRMELRLRPATNGNKRQAIVEGWYRQQIKAAVHGLIAKWELLMDVKVERVFVQRMKTRWGSCNRDARTIRLNTELAKKPPECLEYIVAHEMVHFLERHHNEAFMQYMDQFLPQWRLCRDELNSRPLANWNWKY